MTVSKVDWGKHPKAVKLMNELRLEGNSYMKIAEQINKLFDLNVNEHIVKRAYQKLNPEANAPESDTLSQDELAEEQYEDLDYKSTLEITNDGSHKSDKLLRMSEEQRKDVNFLLQAHGYDSDSWELVSSRSNIWNTYSKQDGINTLYSSKIVARPKENPFSIEKLVASMKEEVEPVFFKKPTGVFENRLLEIPLYDCHFGISDYEYYKPTQEKLMQKIDSCKWEEIVFVIGQDLLHNDDFRGRTSSGREIETVNMEKAWKDCKKFYEPMIDLALIKGHMVKIIYSKGNHDESMSWAFVQYLTAKFPQVVFDDSFAERKIHTYGSCFIGITHGDKGKKSLHNIFPVEFPEEWSKCTTREIHTGHLHQEMLDKDVFGMMVRTLATRNKTDKWHKDNGYVGAHKRFQIFEYTRDALESIHYV